MAVIEVSEPKIQDNNKLIHKFTPDAEASAYFESETLKSKYPVDISDLSEGVLSIPLISNLAPVAWLTGSTIRVNTLDAEFANSLDKIKSGLETAFSRAGLDVTLDGMVDIVDTTPTPESTTSGKPAMLFSGGVDSMSGYLKLQNKNPDLITINKQKEPEEVWNMKKNNILNFSNHYNENSYIIESNFRKDLLDDGEIKRSSGLSYDMSRSLGGGVIHMTGYPGLASPLIKNLDSSVLYISSEGTEDVRNKSMTTAPEVVNSISFSGCDCKVLEYNVGRQEKINRITSSGIQNTSIHIQSCLNPSGDGECNRCYKCKRNILSLFVDGSDPNKFGYELSSDIYDEFYMMFEGGQLEVKPLRYEFLQNIKDNLDKKKWTGPDKLYAMIENSELKIKDTSGKPLKLKIYHQLPDPLANVAYRTYNVYKSVSGSK